GGRAVPPVFALPGSRAGPAAGLAVRGRVRGHAGHPRRVAPVRRGGGGPMNLVAAGVSFRSADVALRERLGFADPQRDLAAGELAARYGCEAVVLSTCNRVELYLAKPAGGDLPDAGLLAEFLAEFHRVEPAAIRPHLAERRD